jgi:glycerophosphoryl diester phosphodiesterase
MFSYEGKADPLFLWGHRGAPWLAVENTVGSFQAAFAHGLHGVEFDVQFSCDGIPFVFHDDDLRRLAQVEKVPSTLLWNELRTITIRDPLRRTLGEARIPRLEEVLAVIPDHGFLNLELKHPGTLEDQDVMRMIRLLDDYAMRERTLISSFQLMHLYRVKDVAPDIALAVLWDGDPSMETIHQVSQSLSPVMHVPLRWLDQHEITSGRLPASMVAVWGLKNGEDVERCRRAGVDAVFIDSPEWVGR